MASTSARLARVKSTFGFRGSRNATSTPAVARRFVRVAGVPLRAISYAGLYIRRVDPSAVQFKILPARSTRIRVMLNIDKTFLRIRYDPDHKLYAKRDLADHHLRSGQR